MPRSPSRMEALHRSEAMPAAMTARPRADLAARLRAGLAERAANGLLRGEPVASDAIDGVWIARDGRRLLGFCGNDYLGLAGDPRLRQALAQAAARYGVGSSAAHGICGEHREHRRLAEALADWLGYPRVLLFSSGYAANLGLMQALLARGDLSVQDKHNHASLIDGARLAGAELLRFRHRDVDSAARQLAARPQAAALLSSDGVFSMDGDYAPLAQLASLARDGGALLHIDDAHGLGVRGPRGAGSVAAAGLGPAEVPLVTVTFGKALGASGAAVACDETLYAALLNGARTRIYTTAMPAALAATLCQAVALVRDDDAGRAKLAANVARLRAGAAQLGLQLSAEAEGPIQPLVLGAPARALAAQAALEQRGLLVVAIRPPTVPAGQARLRITLSAAHQPEHIDRLLEALAEVLRAPAH